LNPKNTPANNPKYTHHPHYVHSDNSDARFPATLALPVVTCNEKADQTVKSALNLFEITAYPLPYSDIISYIKNTICCVATPLA